jgi:nicotinamidase-related amidase
MLDPNQTALILIDLQHGFRDHKWGPRNNPLLERNVASVLRAFRNANLPVIHVRHDSNEADSPLRANARGFAFEPEAEPAQGEKLFTKSAHGAFVNTKLESYLRHHKILQPVFAGLTADHCVSTSVRMANDLGFDPFVIGDAVATFPRRAPDGRIIEANDIHEAALASLDGEFARVVTTAQLVHLLSRRFSPHGLSSPISSPNPPLTPQRSSS